MEPAFELLVWFITEMLFWEVCSALTMMAVHERQVLRGKHAISAAWPFSATALTALTDQQLGNPWYCRDATLWRIGCKK